MKNIIFVIQLNHMAKVFISYSRKDSVIADKVFHALTESGVDVFLDREGIDATDAFPEVIADAIFDCDILLFLISSKSIRSTYTQKEVTYAIKYKGESIIFPLFIEAVQLPRALDLLLCNIQMRSLGPSYSIEKELVEEILRKASGNEENVVVPAPQNNIRVGRRKWGTAVIPVIAVLVLGIIGVMLFWAYSRSRAEDAVQHYESSVDKAVTFLRYCDGIKVPGNPESTFDDEVEALRKGQGEINAAISIKARYAGSSYYTMFSSRAESLKSVVDAKLDSMYTVWYRRAIDSYSYYKQHNDDLERQLSREFATKALTINPEAASELGVIVSE